MYPCLIILVSSDKIFLLNFCFCFLYFVFLQGREGLKVLAVLKLTMSTRLNLFEIRLPLPLCLPRARLKNPCFQTQIFLNLFEKV